MTKLLVIGDSWACGEWSHCGHDQIEITHPGLNQYLASDFTVVNLSRGGASNWQTCHSLFNFLQHQSPLIQDDIHILLIQTDASRDHSGHRFGVDYEKIIKTCQSLQDFYSQIIEIFYIKCNNLAEKFCTKIFMCGGLSDVDLETIKLYNNLVPLCPSWIQLLDQKHQPNTIPLRLSPALLTAAKKQGRADICEEIIQHSDQQFLILQHMLESEYFGPSLGDYHPNRQGHQVFSSFIKSAFKDMK